MLNLKKIPNSILYEICRFHLRKNGYKILYTGGDIIFLTDESKNLEINGASFVIGNLKPKTFKRGTNFVLKENKKFENIVFFIPGEMPTDLLKWVETKKNNQSLPKFHYFNLNKIIDEINEDENRREFYQQKVKMIDKKNFKRMLISSFATLMLGLGLNYGLFTNSKPSNELKDKIENVTQAIQKVSSIEDDLRIIENELKEQQLNSQKIKDEYEKIKNLKTMTLEEIEAFKLMINYESEKERNVERLISFILGVLASIAAYYIINYLNKLKKSTST